MSLKCGLVGLPNVGKSSLFSALAKMEVKSENYPFCTISAQEGSVPLPDARLQQIADIVNPKQIIPTTISFVDIAGLVEGASQGEGMGNQFLSDIASVDLIIHVIRCFEDKDIIHVAGGVDPLFDKSIIEGELLAKDLETLEKRELKIAKKIKKKEREALQEELLLRRFITQLKAGIPGRKIEYNEEEWNYIKNWQLLTQKPMLYVANVDEATIRGEENPYWLRLKEKLNETGAPLISLCATLESAISTMPMEEQTIFLAEYKLTEPALHRLIQRTYKLLGLITYFTAGEQEVRGWTIQRGTLAPEAAGVIHTDFEKGFIKAEVIKIDDFLHYQKESLCRESGKVAIEGKGYEVEDGDIIHFKVRT